MKTLAIPSTEAVSDILFPTSVAPLSETPISTKDRFMATLQASIANDSVPKDPAIAALLQSLNASAKFRQRANGNRRARRSIRIKRMYPKSHLRTQKHAQGFGRKLTQTTNPPNHPNHPSHPNHPNHPNHPHHPHHPNCPDDSKVLRSHAAQTAIDRYSSADSLIEGIQPTFTQIASTLPTDSAPADLSMGWDGTLWAIDQQGAPHSYDPINNEWNVHGEGIDAAAAIGETLYLFRGNQYVTVNVSTQQTSAPLPITTIATNPNTPLPRSFQLGITGATAVGNTLYLFHGGRYWPVDGSHDPLNLTDIPGWPKSAANWADGVIDAVSVSANPLNIEQIELRRGNEILFLQFEDGRGFQVVSGPISLPPQTATITAGATATVGDNVYYFFYSGVQVEANGNPQYIPTLHQNWPATWNPILTHAPSGRMGNLWVATKEGDFVHHNGESWSLALPDAQATSVSVGNDNSVWMAHHSATASFPDVYTAGDPGNGIPNVFDLKGSEDRSFGFDYDGSGKQDHLVFYRTGNGTAGTGKIVIVKNNGDGSFTQVYPAPNAPAQSAIGGYSFDDPGNPLPGQPGNLGFAFDYDGSGKLDHLVFYRPGHGAIYILKNQGGTFTPVYQMENFSGDPNTGIGGYDIRQPEDRGFAFDYDGSGKQDHLVFYRPGHGAIYILKNQGGTFTPVYLMGVPGTGIGGYDLANPADLGFAYDYDGTGKLDHLVFYRPGTGAISILKNNSGSFTAVYQQVDPGNGQHGGGIGDFSLLGQYDQGFAFDYKGTGKQNYLVFYSPGTGKISILQNFNGSFINVYPQGQQTGGIGGYDLAGTMDLGFSFDATGSGNQNGLVFYRPGTGAIFILKTEVHYNPILGDWANGSFTEHPQPAGGIGQVSVGDASKVWVRDGQNNVMQYDSQSQQYSPPNTQVGQAAHIGANNDGTLWHCNNTPNAHRLVSEATAPSEQLSVNTAVTSVQRVATTGFGSSHCLVQDSGNSTAIYRYDSPYVFKTSESYWLDNGGSIATGLGRIYMVSTQKTDYNSGQWSGQLVALDQHTGEEVASSPMVVDSGYSYNNLVLDPLRGLVYITTSLYGDFRGHYEPQLLAFDAQTLTLKWSYTTPHPILASPALEGNRLCFGDGNDGFYMFDTSTFTSNTAPQPVWTQKLTGTGLICFHVTPVIVGSRVYVGYFDGNVVSLVILDATSGNVLNHIPLGSGTLSGYLQNASVIVNSANADADLEVFIPHDGGVYIVKPFAPSPQILTFNLPPGNYLYTPLTYDDGSRVGQTSAPDPSQRRLWFGDNVGQLWSIEWSSDPTKAQKADGTPLQVYQNATISSQPTLYKDSSGGLNVLFGLAALTTSNVTEVTNLLIYAPDAQTHSLLSTGVTSIGALSRLSPADNGVLYAGGSYSLNDPSQVLQVFGIRVDMLVQGLRDFIIESQMLQDPDQTATNGSTDPNNPIPPSVNRYQTHLTVVDDKKSPRAKEPLKIWADKPNTQITLGSFSGTPNGPNGSFDSKTNTYTCTIGPDDGDFVSVSAGVDGAIAIVSDATDMYATPLRVWAGFMNSYERIVVNPDQEFHQRVTTAHADASNNDPTKVNLATTTNYTGTPLFSSDEVTAGQPAQTATAVGQMKQGLNLGGTNTSTRLSYSRLMQGSRLVPHSTEGEQLAATTQAYTAYTDLHGMGYFATNVPSQRLATPVQSVGFIYDSGIDPKNPPPPNTPRTNASISTPGHSAALAEIDSWTGVPWQPSTASVERSLQGRRLGNWWTDFWNWLSNAVEQVIATVLKVVTAIGDAVMVGINMIVKGIEQVFHCKIQFLEDIAAAIGSFFNMLEKVLADVLEALSILFQFGEIIKTQKMIKAFLVDQLLNLENTINTKAIPAIQNQFAQGEAAIAQAFGTAIQSIPNTAVGQQQAIANQPQTQGGFATPHTVATVQSQGGSSSSQAVQSNWGTQKMKAGMPSASLGSTYAQTLGADDPFGDFFTSFLSSVEDTISANFADMQSKFSTNFSSPSSFFDSLLQDFLVILEDFIEIGLGIAQDLIVGDSTKGTQGLLQLFESLITYLIGTDGNGGILGSRIEIPVITWLFELIFQEDLSFLNLITFVVAIPVTVLFKIISGKYPSETTLPTALSTATVNGVGSSLDALWDEDARTICGVIYVFVSFIGGIIALVSDTMDDAAVMVASFVCATSLPSIPLSLPYFTTSSPEIEDWFEFGLTAGGYLAGMGLAVVAVTDNSEATGKASVGVMAIYSLISLVLFSIIFGAGSDQNKWDDVSFADSLLSWINGLVNPLKFIPEVKPLILFFDVALPLTAGILTCADYMDARMLITVENYITADPGYSVVLVQDGSVIATLADGTISNPSSGTVNVNPDDTLLCQQQDKSNPPKTIPICHTSPGSFEPGDSVTVKCGFGGSGDNVECQLA